MNYNPPPVVFNEFEWDNLVEFLKTCPGRLSAAVVPGEAAQSAIISRLPRLLEPMPVETAPSDANPQELARLALTAGQNDAVLIIPTIGRRDLSDDNQARAFWEQLNFQRERLAANLVRTLFIVTEKQDGFMLRFCDDLRDWVHAFRFPEAVAPRDERRDPATFQMPVTTLTGTASIEVMKDQLERARKSAMNPKEIVRDYMAPLFKELVNQGKNKNALNFWKEYLLNGDVLEEMEARDKLDLLQKRTRLANQLDDINDLGQWSWRYLEEAEHEGGSYHQAHAWCNRGDFFRKIDNKRDAVSALESALGFFRAIGDQSGEAGCIMALGDVMLYHFHPDHEEAQKRYEEALLIYQKIGDLRSEANCVLGLGNIALESSDYKSAMTLFECALSIYLKIGNVLGEADCIKGMGDIARQSLDPDSARARYEEALLLYRKSGSLLGEANCIRNLGDIDLFHSDYEAALARYEQALIIYRETGDYRGPASILWQLYNIPRQLLDRDEAHKVYPNIIDLCRRSNLNRPTSD